MTSAGSLTFRTVAFGDLSGGVWGVVVAGPQSFWTIGAGQGRASHVDGLTIDHDAPANDWRVLGDGIELTVGASGDAARVGDPAQPEGESGFDQLCHVRGQAEIGGEPHAIDARGVRGGRAEIALDGSDSIRAAWAWFEPADGLALVAVRPRRPRGHGRDAVTATVLEPSLAATVTDPRLSTTYGADGSPLRAGVELWLEHESEQYPRRAAGEAIAAGETIESESLEVRSALMRWHMRGAEGAGLYLLARAR